MQQHPAGTRVVLVLGLYCFGGGGFGEKGGRGRFGGGGPRLALVPGVRCSGGRGFGRAEGGRGRGDGGRGKGGRGQAVAVRCISNLQTLCLASASVCALQKP